jgi:hypothetical protein
MALAIPKGGNMKTRNELRQTLGHQYDALIGSLRVKIRAKRVACLKQSFEDARFEMHPSLVDNLREITDRNVLDIINDTIESGVEHPALTARKASYSVGLV